MGQTQRYEIYQKLQNRAVRWVENAADLEDAKRRWQELTQMFPSEYFILDGANSVFIIPSPSPNH